MLHRAVMSVVLGRQLGRDEFVCHRDDDRRNNWPQNLYIGDYHSNAADSLRNGGRVRGEQHPSAKLSDEQVREIRRALARGERGGSCQASPRVVPMSVRARDILCWHVDHANEFPVGPQRDQKIVKQVANRTRIRREVNPHVLRHAFATLALGKGISLGAVQKVLGHDRSTTTQIFLNFTDINVRSLDLPA